MKAENGDIITIEYSVSLESGRCIDSSKEEPLSFKLGEGNVIRGLETAIEGMQEKEEKGFIVEPEDGYGETDEDLKRSLPINVFPDEVELTEGESYTFMTEDERILHLRVLELNEDDVFVDMNHPLAGEKLVFEIKVIQIEKP